MSQFDALERRVLLSTLPANFTETTVANLNTTVAATMAFAPDGRAFVGDTTHGQIRVIKNGSLLTDAALTLNVDRAVERGINGIAFAPDFATAAADKKYVFIYYTVADPANPNVVPNDAFNRLSRFTISATNSDKLDPASEKILIDNIASTNGNHNGGALHFGADGKLYLGVGEAGVSSNAQTLTNVNGKILRINPDGSIPSDNPFVASLSARPEIWAYGFRNPFTGAFQPGTSNLYINEVGQASWEEIDVVQKGANFGWPNAEGVSSNPDYVNPIYSYPHNGKSVAITGADFYSGTRFPAAYQGKYFFGDYILKTIWTLDPTTHASTTFATNTLQVVDIDTNPVDGSLWYLDVKGNVQKITYTPPATTTTLRATADAYVRDGSSANTNFGSAIELDVKKNNVGFNRESYLKFDLTGVNTVGSAKLRLYGKLSTTEASSVSVGVYPVSSTTWGENTITYGNKPAAGTTALTTGTIVGTTAKYYEFDVSSYIKSNTGKLVSFDLKSPNTSLPLIVFNSDEAASNPPQLMISPTSSGTTLRATNDAYVRDGSSAGTNFGSDTSLNVKKNNLGFNRETYLTFNLSSVSTINSAKLRLFGGLQSTPANSVRIAAYGVTGSWSESTLTWNTRPTTGTTALATTTLTDATQRYYEWDLTSYLKSEKSLGHTTVSIALKALDISDPLINFASDEAGANTPQLVVT